MEQLDYLKVLMTESLNLEIDGPAYSKGIDGEEIHINVKEEHLKNKLGFNMDELIEIDDYKFLKELLKNNLSFEELECIADIIFEIGKAKNFESVSFCKKSLIVYNYVVTYSSKYSYEWNKKIMNVNQYLFSERL